MERMHVRVREDLCVCTGNCVRIVPEVFRLVEDGSVEVIHAFPDEAIRDRVEEAEAMCPSDAIEVLRDA